MPLDDSALDDAIQGLIAGVTGLDGTLVRPLYSNPPLPEPELSVNWMAVGIAETDDVGYPALQHVGATATADGYDKLTQNEELRFLVASFGPLAHAYLMLLRDGLNVPQNIQALKAQGIKYTGASTPVRLPRLRAQQFQYRWDCQIIFQRARSRVYPILDIKSATVNLRDDSGQLNATITVEKP